MLQSVQHKSTVCKNGQATYTYIVADSAGTKEVAWTMPVQMAILGAWLSPIAVHRAYADKGLDALRTALDEYYNWLQREGHDSKQVRRNDLEFYRRALQKE